MKTSGLAAAALVMSLPLSAQSWPFPVPAGTAPAPREAAAQLHTVPGSKLSFPLARASNRYDIADWFPESHIPAPNIVLRGRAPSVIACGLCHLPDGTGRPENAQLAGLPMEYIIRQVTAIRDRTRKSAGPTPFVPMDLMRSVADSITATELRIAARYFSRLKPKKKSRVVEADTIPKPVPALGIYFASPDSARERLGARIIEVPVDVERHELHDPNVGYIAYVPRGSIARGWTLATKGAGAATPACITCHGPELRGMALAPPIAGRSPSSLFRQLLAFKTGARATTESVPMNAVAKSLSLDDLIAAAAYAGSRSP
jgi:cytochrome c553